MIAAFLCTALLLAYGCGGTGGQENSGMETGDASQFAAEGWADRPAEGLERIVLGGGCFWCTEAVMELVDGVAGVTSGYAGGTTLNPTYEEVCSGRTGHAEVVAVDYDPSIVSLEEILDVFFDSHDPTTLNRQGHDRGTQYRSIILYGSEDHGERARTYVEGVAERYDDPVVTEVEKLDSFYPAEDYHQDYFSRNGDAPYCRAVISPKVEKARKSLDLP